MKAVLQRVSEASLVADGEFRGRMDRGLVVLLGIGRDDNAREIPKLVKKILQMRIFADEAGKMNKSVGDIGGSVMVVSQFTLYADCKKGNRPSFLPAAPPDIAVPLYEEFLAEMRRNFEGEVITGVFGADMKVSLANDGPVTILLPTD